MPLEHVKTPSEWVFKGTIYSKCNYFHADYDSVRPENMRKCLQVHQMYVETEYKWHYYKPESD